MLFFIGWHQPCNGKSGCGEFDYAMISVNRLLARKSPFLVKNWLLDSGAFSRITSGKGHLPVEEYANEIMRWSNVGNLMGAVCQDFMCEPIVLEKTGMTIKEHQRLTIENYDNLLLALKGKDHPPILPVLQGYTTDDYLSHLKDWGYRLTENMWVGVGSICKRNGKPEEIIKVILPLKLARPDLRLHGFGVKKKSLENPMIWDILYSADSQAATLSKGQGSNKYVGDNDPETALRYAQSIQKPISSTLFSLI